MGCERKSVIMPDVKEILQRTLADPEVLHQVTVGQLLGEDVLTTMANFLKAFAARIGGKEIDGFGLNQQWTQAAVETLETPAPAGVLIRPLFERLITITVPDSDVVKDGLEIRRRYIDELNRLNKPERHEWAHLGDWDQV